jgi:hypothetical protein
MGRYLVCGGGGLCLCCLSLLSAVLSLCCLTLLSDNYVLKYKRAFFCDQIETTQKTPHEIRGLMKIPASFSSG